MTKGELIKLLQDAPFGDNATVQIGHNIDCSVIIHQDQHLDIKRIDVIDENELSIQLELDQYVNLITKYDE